MDSKTTKATQRQSTKSPSSSTARASCTGVRSRESKSISKDCEPSSRLCWASQRGLDSEKRVISFLRERSYELVAHRLKTPYAEVDLLMRAPDGSLLMVEVKSANIADFYCHRISQRQKQRLLRAVSFLSDHFDVLVEVNWAFVSYEGEITLIEDVCG